MPIDFSDILNDFINPPQEEKRFFSKRQNKEEIRIKLVERVQKYNAVKDMLKTPAWQMMMRPHIVDSFKASIGKIVRNGLEMNEAELKSTIADARASIAQIAHLREVCDSGVRAGNELNKMEKK